MRPNLVVVSLPSLEEHLGLSERVEDPAVEQLVAEFAIQALVVAILSQGLPGSM